MIHNGFVVFHKPPFLKILTARKDEKCRGAKFRPSVRNMGKWRKGETDSSRWQTRGTISSEVLYSISCWFKSNLAHQNNYTRS